MLTEAVWFICGWISNAIYSGTARRSIIVGAPECVALLFVKLETWATTTRCCRTTPDDKAYAKKYDYLSTDESTEEESDSDTDMEENDPQPVDSCPFRVLIRKQVKIESVTDETPLYHVEVEYSKNANLTAEVNIHELSIDLGVPEHSYIESYAGLGESLVWTWSDVLIGVEQVVKHDCAVAAGEYTFTGLKQVTAEKGKLNKKYMIKLGD